MTKIITMGEILLRLTPINHNRLSQSGDFRVCYGGAEANVAMSLSKFGHDVIFLSALPEHDLGEAALKQLQSENVKTNWISRIGHRIGTYYYEPGFSLKNPQVIYDRAHSSIYELPHQRIDWDALYTGIDIIHTTGITPALSYELQAFTLQALKEAQKRHVQISFDFNYRSKLWSKEEAKKVYLEILPYVDICFAGYNDFVHLLDEEGPDKFNKDFLKKYYAAYSEKYNIRYFAGTNRTVYSSLTNDLQGYVYTSGQLHASKLFSFNMLERIGGGDAFAAGVLHGILQEKDTQSIVDFGAGASVMKHFIQGDHNQFNEEDIMRFLDTEGKDVNR